MKIANTLRCTVLPAVFFLLAPAIVSAQTGYTIDSFRMWNDIRVTIDRPVNYNIARPTVICFFALPNGNTTEQTMGKKMQPGDDWHFDIQHIGAQTTFIRNTWPQKNFVVIYLENAYKSWPAWKQKHPEFRKEIPSLVDTLTGLFPNTKKSIYLNGHSGGGSFIFGYLAGVGTIPANIKRISFIDSDYGYDSSYYPILRHWLKDVPGSSLNVFAYNDSVALYNGKPLVSATGGTWYRSHLLLQHLSADFRFSRKETDSIEIFKGYHDRIQFFFKYNLNRGIYHTQQVERNGFIHSIFAGTAYDSRNYKYYDQHAYSEYIR